MAGDKYIDSGFVLGNFRDRIFVKCPKCEKAALVKGSGDWPIKPGSIVCIYCSYNQKSSVDNWKGPIVTFINRRCGHCGYRNQYSDEKPYYSSRYKKNAEIKCRLCGKLNSIKINWWPKRFADTEPYFGLPLFFKAQVGKNTLWVYNIEHLEELIQFTSAKIRERNTEINYTTMVEKLPRWLINHKSRTAVLKVMSRVKLEIVNVYEDYGIVSTIA